MDVVLKDTRFKICGILSKMHIHLYKIIFVTIDIRKRFFANNARFKLISVPAILHRFQITFFI